MVRSARKRDPDDSSSVLLRCGWRSRGLFCRCALLGASGLGDGSFFGRHLGGHLVGWSFSGGRRRGRGLCHQSDGNLSRRCAASVSGHSFYPKSEITGRKRRHGELEQPVGTGAGFSQYLLRIRDLPEEQKDPCLRMSGSLNRSELAHQQCRSCRRLGDGRRCQGCQDRRDGSPGLDGFGGQSPNHNHHCQCDRDE